MYDPIALAVIVTGGMVTLLGIGAFFEERARRR